MKILVIILAAILTVSLYGQGYRSHLETDTLKVYGVYDSLHQDSVIRVQVPYTKGVFYKTIYQGKEKVVIKIVVQ